VGSDNSSTSYKQTGVCSILLLVTSIEKSKSRKKCENDVQKVTFLVANFHIIMWKGSLLHCCKEVAIVFLAMDV